VRLHPPGTKPALKRPARKKPRRAKKRPAPKPKPPAAVASAPEPAPEAPPMAEAPPPAPPAPPEPKPVAKAPPLASMEPKGEAKAPPPPEQTAALPKPPAGGTAFKVGTTHAIAFGAGSASLPNDAAATLKAAAELLNSNAALRVQIKAYAAGEKDNESKARRLSLSRALGVRSVLIKEGVQPTRIDVRALGSQVPDGAPDRVDLSVVSR